MLRAAGENIRCTKQIHEGRDPQNRRAAELRKSSVKLLGVINTIDEATIGISGIPDLSFGDNLLSDGVIDTEINIKKNFSWTYDL